MTVLGVVMAGGRNSRFGDLKAFAEVAGEPIINRVVAALRAAADEVVLNTNDAPAYSSTGLETRPDVWPDLGALGGIFTGLLWARERGHQGILAVACDMPFPSAQLLRALLDHAADHDVVLPESDGRRGVEPLFAYYSISCVPAIEQAIARADRRMIGFHEDVRVHRLPLDDVRAFGAPEMLFMNVNSRDELVEAQRMARERGA